MIFRKVNSKHIHGLGKNFVVLISVRMFSFKFSCSLEDKVTLSLNHCLFCILLPYVFYFFIFPLRTEVYSFRIMGIYLLKASPRTDVFLSCMKISDYKWVSLVLDLFRISSYLRDTLKTPDVNLFGRYQCSMLIK